MGKKQNERELRRNKIIEEAVEVANDIIMDGSDGSTEETNFLTAKVAARLIEMALLPFSQTMLAKDIDEGL